MNKKERRPEHRIVLARFNPIFIKYFISYFIIVIILIGCFYLLFRFNFISIYQDHLQESAEKQLSSIKTTLDSEVTAFVLLDAQIKKDLNLIMSNYTDSAYDLYQANKKLTAYASANNMIDSISVLSSDGEVLLSTALPVVLFEDGYRICVGGKNYPIPLDEYLSAPKRHFFRLDTGNKSFLIYLAPRSQRSSMFTVYVLSLQGFDSILNSESSKGVVSFWLLDADCSFLAGDEPDALFSLADELPSSSGLHEIDASNSLYMIADDSDNAGNLVLTALLSNQEIARQTETAMGRSIIVFALVFLLSLFIILLAMQATFKPLQKLIKKIIPADSSEHNYISLLEDTFSKLAAEKYTLQEKLNNYRRLIQKSLFDSVIQSPSDIDSLFSMESDKCAIYIARITNDAGGPDFPEHVELALSEGLQAFEKKIVAMIEYTQEHAVVLISYYDDRQNGYGHTVITVLLEELHKKLGCHCVYSDRADSPMEIPALYKNVMAACSPVDESVVLYTSVIGESRDSGHLQYPISQLEELTRHLRNSHFTEARACVTELIGLLDSTSDVNENPFINFYVRSILIDILTILTNAISEYNAKFKDYSDLYFSTLYLCRSCPYEENSGTILKNMLALLDFCKESSDNIPARFSQIEEIMNAEYASPDFSITVLADAFHISIAHMSSLFKIRFGKNFSEYLWEMRLEKAKGLLLGTDQTIDQISTSVGYVNVSSFRRKFKQEVGVSPSQYREQNI